METTQKKDLEFHEKRPVAAAEGTRPGRFFEPQVDIYENDSSLTLAADLPGVRVEDLSVDVRDGVLTVSGQVAPVEERWRRIHTEYEIGHFQRQFRLGEKIDQARIHAQLKNGVLALELPKVERAQPRKIQVRGEE